MIYNSRYEYQDLKNIIETKDFEISQLMLTIKFLQQQITFSEKLYDEMSRIKKGD